MESADKNNFNVEVHSVLTVVSATPVSPSGRTCPLTALDQIMGQHTLHAIFYYRSSSLDFQQLRTALNELLTLYPSVTGRLARDSEGNWEVRRTDAGVRVYRAKVETSVDEWLRCATADDEKQLTVHDELPDDPQFWSPFRIKVTDFEEGGTAIAMTCPHMLADPTSVTLIIKSWTEALQRAVIAHPPFLQPLAISNMPKADTSDSTTSIYYADESAKSGPGLSVRMSTTTFSFSDSTIKHSLSEICSSFPDATPFDLLVALFWTRIANLKTANRDSKQKVSICLDMRERLRAPLPLGYFGNALHFLEITLNVNEAECNDTSQIAKLVHSHVSGIKEEELWSGLRWLQSRKSDQGKFAPPFRMYGPELTFVSMEHMIAPNGSEAKTSQPLMYLARFENDQKPAHVSYHIENTEGEGLIFIMPSPEEGLARRVSVMLPEEEMRELLKDEVILSLEPTLLLSGRR